MPGYFEESGEIAMEGGAATPGIQAVDDPGEMVGERLSVKRSR